MQDCWQAVTLLLTNNVSASPSLRGMHLLLSLAQQLSERITASRLLVFTSGTMATVPGASHGGAWGFTRVIRLEHPELSTQTANLSGGESAMALPALAKTSSEAEVAWSGDKRLVARLRVSSSASDKRATFASGLHAITGGLGGLGLRAASLLIEGGATGVMLASRSGRIVRDGQGLMARLKSLRTAASVMACDGADALDTNALLSSRPLSGVMHAAGASDKGLIVELREQSLQWMYASKAMGAWHLHCASPTAPRESYVLWSSIGSGLGNVGQANYAGGNASLDAHASSIRACAT